MTDGATCPFCGDALDGVTCGRRVECFDQALEQGLIVEEEETPEQLAKAEEWLAELQRDAEAHAAWLNSQKEVEND